MGEDWDSWASIIRSCALTSKTPLTIHELNRDTKMLEGNDIPFRAFGFKTLEEMLRKVPGIRVFTSNGSVVVQTIATEATAHIAKFVRLQKSSKKKPRTLPKFNRFNTARKSYSNNRPPLGNANRNNVPNRSNIQNRFNVPMNRSNSTEPMKKPTPMMHSTPLRSNSSDAMKKTPTPLMQVPITPPPISPNQKPLLPTPRMAPKTMSGLSSIQHRLSPTPLMQQKVEMPHPPTPKSNLAQRLSAAQHRIIPDPTIDDPRLRLNSYAEARKLPLPVYKDLPVKNNSIYSSVTIDNKKYSSYPQEAKTKDDAEKLAAQVALKELLKDKSPQSTTKDHATIVKRVLAIVNDHPNGMFESCVVETYIARYNEGLSKDWLKIVDHVVTVDIGANNLTILSPLSISSNPNRPISPRARSPLSDPEPEVLKLNDMNEFWLHIYAVYSTTDIWGVIIDENHSDKIEGLASEMKKFYDTNPSPVPTIAPGKYYTVLDSDCYHRVRCIKVDPETQQAIVFFIDRGDEDLFPVARLRSLQNDFCHLPAQSVRLSMTGLESFAECEDIRTTLEEILIDKDVFVKNIKIDPKYRDDKYMCFASAELYLNDEVSANDELKQEIMKIFDPISKMGTDKTAQQGFISNVDEKTIFVQLKSKGLEFLNELMNKLTKECLKNSHYKLKPVLRFDATKMYVVENSQDHKWYRVKISRIINENEAQVMCIDVGNTIKINRQNLVLLEDLSEVLLTFPKQAIQVQLHKISPINFDKKMAAHLRKLAPKNDLFYLKVVGILENVPIVEFYKRTEDNYLASLNDTLALEPEISKDDNNNAKPRLRNDRSSMGGRTEFPLKAPSIPPVGSYFDVHITMAAHPGNFTIQPLQNVKELEKLMTELSQACNSYVGPPLTPSAIKVGNMYAAKYDDGRWYRAYVSKVISKNVCAVYFCDYGDYRAVSLDLLLPLQNQFYDLPYQAMKAKLHGITPKLKGDWSVKDTLRFNELIVAKNFVSLIKSCDMDNFQSGETVLSLELIDTNTLDDIYITDILVNENRADKIEEAKV